MAVTDAEGDPLTAMVIRFTRRSERAQAAVFAWLLRRDIASMKRKVSKADAAWERRCASDVHRCAQALGGGAGALE
jgi:hypothetical protein